MTTTKNVDAENVHEVLDISTNLFQFALTLDGGCKMQMLTEDTFEISSESAEHLAQAGAEYFKRQGWSEEYEPYGKFDRADTMRLAVKRSAVDWNRALKLFDEECWMVGECAYLDSLDDEGPSYRNQFRDFVRFSKAGGFLALRFFDSECRVRLHREPYRPNVNSIGLEFDRSPMTTTKNVDDENGQKVLKVSMNLLQFALTLGGPCSVQMLTADTFEISSESAEDLAQRSAEYFKSKGWREEYETYSFDKADAMRLAVERSAGDWNRALELFDEKCSLAEEYYYAAVEESKGPEGSSYRNDFRALVRFSKAGGFLATRDLDDFCPRVRLHRERSPDAST